MEPVGPGAWRPAVVREVVHPHPDAVILKLEVPQRVDHLPGQHYVVRLTAEDGYTATRSYSLASAPHEPLIELYVERLDDGEVSPYLADAVEVDDELEVRGPIGGWFVWDGTAPGVGIGGGSGVVPLVAMLRHAIHLGRTDLLRVVAAARNKAQLPYADELAEAGAWIALSRENLPLRPASRLTEGELLPVVTDRTTYYICGSSGFAEAASVLLMGLGVPAAAVRVERFGPSG